MKYEPRTDDLSIPQARLVVLGDPHADHPGLDRVLAEEDGKDACFVSVGDNIGYADGPTSSLFCGRLSESRIRSVYGNHEEWMGPEGALAIVRPSGSDSSLTPNALSWCAELPQRLNLVFPSVPHLTATVIHHIEIDYFDFEAVDVKASIERLGTDLIFVGHTHGPKIFEWRRDGEVDIHRLDLEAAAPLRIGIRPGHRYVVDAGSLANPGHYPEPSHSNRASYAVLDLERQTISLKSLQKPR